MMFLMLGAVLFLLPILFRLALKLRLGIPMLYAVLMLTAFLPFQVSSEEFRLSTIQFPLPNQITPSGK